MALPPKKPQTGRAVPGKPAAKPPAPPAKGGAPTRRGATAPASGRASAPAAPAKNNLPLILGLAGGAVAIVIILFVALSGGEEHKAEKTKPKEAKPEAAKKAPPPDVSGLEATGKSKCEEGMRIIQPRLNLDPSSPKDRVFNDLENGLKLMKEGLDAYKKATEIAGKKYPLDEYNKIRDRAIKIFCTELESEGTKLCEEGLKIVKGSESKIVDTNKLSDAERSQLYDELKKAQEKIRSGMGLLSRSEGVSGHTFDTTQYQEALKVVRPKLAELKSN